jgi:polar amino acid transport system substrate-binding protein
MKNKKFGFFGLAALSAVLLAGVPSCASQTLVGFDIDLSKAVAAALGVKVQFQEIVWEQKEIELNAKNIDLIWNGMTITDDRKAAMDFSIPYLENKQVLVAKNAFAATITSSSAYQIAVESGSAGSDAFDGNDIFKGSSKVEVTDQVTALTEVLSGTSDLAIIDSVMAGYYLSSSSSYGSSLKILSSYSFAGEYYGIGGRKGEDAFLAKIDEGLASLYAAGTTATIAAKYGLQEDLVAPSSFDAYSAYADTSSWDNIVKKGEITIGYTIFAPIAFEG